ncbi:MAG: hypothetical protein QW075_02500, partial [Thermofilaceae archaeon]
TIKVSKETKELLTEVLVKLEEELGRRLTYDEVIRVLVRRSGVRNPSLLLKLADMSVPEEVVVEARNLLEGEMELEMGVFERRYGSRYERPRRNSSSDEGG